MQPLTLGIDLQSRIMLCQIWFQFPGSPFRQSNFLGPVSFSIYFSVSGGAFHGTLDFERTKGKANVFRISRMPLAKRTSLHLHPSLGYICRRSHWVSIIIQGDLAHARQPVKTIPHLIMKLPWSGIKLQASRSPRTATANVSQSCKWARVSFGCGTGAN